MQLAIRRKSDNKLVATRIYDDYREYESICAVDLYPIYPPELHVYELTNEPTAAPAQPTLHAVSFAMTNLMYFMYNYPSGWIDAVWADGNSAHMHDKFGSYYSALGPVLGFCSFYMELSSDNKDLLNKWIAKNYDFQK
jgi:hypothetical protein